VKTELDEYIESLPAANRPARDRSARRQRLLPALRVHAERERRRVRRRRFLARAAGVTILGGATAAAALWLGVGLPSKPAAPARGAPAAVTVVDGVLLLESAGVARTLHGGDSVGLAEVGALEASGERPVHVRLSDVVLVTLAPSARVRPIATGGGRAGGDAPALEVLALERGRAHFQVKKLADARRFHVVTPDADVEVRGTAFDVALRPGGAPQTCVAVTDGLVMVASGLTSHLLAPGESWGCDEARAGGGGDEPKRSTAAATAMGVTAVGDAGATSGGSRGARRQRAVAGAAASDLRAQNQLFQSALAAERAGRIDEAARTYRQLLARAPRGALAAQARANLAVVATNPRR
jgi:ferric-dicitrate binding protein FerR (iron transport regulator)